MVMSDDRQEKIHWVTRVLDVVVAEAQASRPAPAAQRGQSDLARRLQAAYDGVASNLVSFGATLLADRGVTADPRLPQVKAMVAKFPHYLPQLSANLSTSLQQYGTATDVAARAAAAAMATAEVGAFAQALAAADPITSLQKLADRHFAGIRLCDELHAALSEISAALGGKPEPSPHKDAADVVSPE
jgi:hypothetical protein